MKSKFYSNKYLGSNDLDLIDSFKKFFIVYLNNIDQDRDYELYNICKRISFLPEYNLFHAHYDYGITSEFDFKKINFNSYEDYNSELHEYNIDEIVFVENYYDLIVNLLFEHNKLKSELNVDILSIYIARIYYDFNNKEIKCLFNITGSKAEWG